MDHSDGIDQARYSFQHANLYKTNQQCCYFWQKGKEKKMEMEKSNRSCPYRVAVVQRVTELLQGVQKLDIVTGLIG